MSPELTSLRALEVLELAGTTEAQGVLRRLGGGAQGARVTQLAIRSLERLDVNPGNISIED